MIFARGWSESDTVAHKKPDAPACTGLLTEIERADGAPADFTAS
jgi:hypothetical protein